jgi:hypothetical protein
VRLGRTVPEALMGDAIMDTVMATALYGQRQRLVPLHMLAPRERKFGRTVLA